MCLIAFAIGVQPGCPLLLASNRDELFDRPTDALSRWNLPDGTRVVTGRDQRDGGTWLGMGENGRVAMLTNVRSAAAATGPRSRGELPLAWLQGDAAWRSLLAQRQPCDHGGFNLVLGDLRTAQWTYWSNRDPRSPHQDNASPAWHQQTLAPGVHTLSNAALNTPWPKALHLQTALSEALLLAPGDARQHLARALADREVAPDGLLPRTGVPTEQEKSLSAAFVDLTQRRYGTRSSLIVRVDQQPGALAVRMDEWTHEPPRHAAHTWCEAQRRTEAWQL